MSVPNNLSAPIAMNNTIEEHSKATKQFLRQSFKDVIEDMSADEVTISRYFSKEYVQEVDGKILNYKEFVDHMKTQKAAVLSIEINVENMLVEGDEICSVHLANVVKKNKEKAQLKVFSLIKIRDGKIVSCKELTSLIEGTKSDKDIGSCTSH